MKLRLHACLSILAWFVIADSSAETPQDATPLPLISPPSLSPDGQTMVFGWAHDLWTAPSSGGEAVRVVNHPAGDAHPRFSPDGKRIVFSSDRSGSMQVYSIPSDGGEATRHTWHTEGNRLECISPDGTRAIVRGIRDLPGKQAFRLMEIDLTRDSRERRLFDAAGHSATWSPDGKRLLFCRGGEQTFRKGYHGSRASQIWVYETGSRRFECLVNSGAEAASPMWLPDGKSFYFVSNQSGTANLWLKEYGKAARQVTHYEDDGVLTPTISADGSILVFRRGLDVLRFRPATDRSPSPIELWTREPLADVSTETQKITGTTSADFTGDLQQVVFSAAGDLWQLNRSGESPARLTDTPAAEEDVRFSTDQQWLYFLRDDGLQANYYRARIRDGALCDESPVTIGNRSKSRLKASPDGSQIAWIEGTGDVFTARADGSLPRRVFACWDRPTFDWSPDGRWLALAAEGADANRDILLVRADGSREAINLTRHPGFEGSPRWSPDGRWLVFSARRGSSGKTELWRMDLGKNGPPPDLTHEEAVRLGDSATVISTRGIEPTRVMWSPDSKSLWFQSRQASSKKLYSVGVIDGRFQVMAEQRGVPIRATSDGALLWRVDRSPAILKGGQTKRFQIEVTAERQRQAILTLGFRRIWRTLAENFYDPKMTGCDWEAMRKKYEEAAVSARNSRQFDRVISQLLGELNASHLVFQRRPWPGETTGHSKEKRTAHPGWEFADDHPQAGAPLRIKRVISGSPVASLPDPPKAGDTVVRIAGQAVTNGTPLHPFFNGAAGTSLPVVLRGADNRERVIELRCISYSKARALIRKNREAAARALLSRKLGNASYFRVPDMSKESLSDLELEIYRASLDSKGLILDFRANGGGREADRMLGLFCQPEHSMTIPRGGPRGYPLERRPSPTWKHPLVVLCNQDTYSNAEVFCHAVQQIRRAPLVGTATAGGVISAVKTTVPDVGVLQVPFRGWFRLDTGKNMDLNGAQPDYPVAQTPADEDAGHDAQLAKAIDVLGEKIGRPPTQ